MTIASIREQWHRQVETLPDEIIAEIADFTAFVLARRKSVDYVDWEQAQWQTFVLEQFSRESGEDVEYTLEDAKEVYWP